MLLVTGITGHSGRYFLQELINNNYEDKIRCIVRKTSDTAFLDRSGLDIEKRIGDLDDLKFIYETMIGVDTVMHIYNIKHSPMIIKAALDRNVERVILVHTTGIYSKFKNASQEYKDIEKRVLKISKNKIDVTILRPTMIYGDLCDHNISKFIKIIDKVRVLPVINGGNNLIQPVNARDLGKAFFSVLMKPDITSGNNYDLSGDKPVKLIDLFKLIRKELNKKTIFVSVPLKIGTFLAGILKLITMGRIDYIEKIQRMGEDRSYDHDAATRDFGFRPMSLENGIHKEVQSYLNLAKLS
jgi:nucleoside-diphosphate-sugar epimerase